MSSPDRAKAGAKTGAKTGASKPPKAPSAKAAAVKAAPAASAKVAKAPKAVAKAPAKAAAKTQGASPQHKAAFLKAMAKGIAPNSAASRKLVEKKGSPFAPAPASKPAQKVELLRRIPAPAAIVNTPESEAALQLVATIERMLAADELGKIQPHAQQALIAALCKLYAANAEAGERYAILGGRTLVTATDVMVVCGALLKAVDLQVFELGMWQSWSTG